MRLSGRRARRTGFTLVEVAIAIVIVGLAVVSLVTASGACTRATHGSRQLTQAVFLAQSIREWSIQLPLTDPDPADEGSPLGPDPNDAQGIPDDLDDLMGMIFDPPRDGAGSPMSNFQGWSQTVTLTWVDPEALTPVAPGWTDAVEVQVAVSFEGQPVFTTSWLVTRR